jgi:hypothetical protein
MKKDYRQLINSRKNALGQTLWAARLIGIAVITVLYVFIIGLTVAVGAIFMGGTAGLYERITQRRDNG